MLNNNLSAQISPGIFWQCTTQMLHVGTLEPEEHIFLFARHALSPNKQTNISHGI